MKDYTNFSREELTLEVLRLQEELAVKEAEANWYKQQYELDRQRRFGRSSEAGFSNSDQMDIFDFIPYNEGGAFNEAERDVSLPNAEPDLNAVTDNTSKNKPGRKNKDLSALETDTQEFMLSESEKVCPNCGEHLHEMKKEVRVSVEVIPAKTIVHKYITHVYACRNCEKNGKATIIRAKGDPGYILPGSIVSPSLGADIITKKYELALPYDRMAKWYQSVGIPITKNNLCNWSINIYNKLLSLITARYKEILMSKDIIHSDETELEILHENKADGFTGAVKSYIWVTTTTEREEKEKIALYQYEGGRSTSAAREVLKGFKGYIMCDGYGVYDSIKKPEKMANPEWMLQSLHAWFI